MSEHIVIVGGGVVGLCSAYEAVRRGLRVTLIDRRPSHRDGCSFGNAGMIVPSHVVPLAAPGAVALGLKWMWNPESPFYIRPRASLELLAWGWRFWRSATKGHVERAAPLLRDLHLTSRALYEAWSAELPDFGLTRLGLLMLCRTQHGLDEEAHGAELARRLGIPADVLDPTETAKLDPGVTMQVAGSVHYPRDCHFDPSRFMASLQQSLEERGTEFRFNTEVTQWLHDAGRLRAVATSAGESIEGDEFVLAGGAWSGETSRALGLGIPMQSGKGYSLTLSRPRQLPQLCSILTEARVAVTPMGEQLRFGGTMEIAGRDETINPRRIQGIVKSIPHYFPEFQAADFAGIKPWVGLRPCSPDGLPYLGRSKRWQNLVVATGHAMMGMSLGPVTGRLVGELLTKAKPEIDLTLLAPERFG